MEEKERYEFDGYCIIDNEKRYKEQDITICDIDDCLCANNIVALLNQQANRIKELEETLEKARQREIIIHQNYRQASQKDYENLKSLEQENQQLKQQLHDLPKKIVEYIKIYKGFYFDWKIGQKIFPAFKITEEDLDTILKKYGGKNESK